MPGCMQTRNLRCLSTWQYFLGWFYFAQTMLTTFAIFQLSLFLILSN
jgi:hypothetical protein